MSKAKKNGDPLLLLLRGAIAGATTAAQLRLPQIGASFFFGGSPSLRLY